MKYLYVRGTNNIKQVEYETIINEETTGYGYKKKNT